MIHIDKAGREDGHVIIKSIKLNAFAGIDFYEACFDSRDVQLDEPAVAEAVRMAIAVVLKSVTVNDFIDKISISPDSLIESEIDIKREVFFISVRGHPNMRGFEYEVRDNSGRSRFDFYDNIHLSEEEDRLAWFRYDYKDPYSQRLKHYKEANKYYPEGGFSSLTE